MRRQLDLDDFSPPVLSFNVAHQSDGGRQSLSTMTDQFQMKDMRVETIIRNSEKVDFGLQTSSGGQREKQKETQKQVGEVEIDAQGQKRVQKFLRKVGALMQAQLDQNLPLYQGLANSNKQQLFRRQSRLLHTLQLLQGTSNEGLQISCVSWNCTSSVIAAGYSRFQSDLTSPGKGMVCLWGIFKRNFKPTRPQVLQVASYVNCMSFHPKKPSIFAIGTYNGQVLLYDFSKKQNPLLGKTMVDDYFHRDCVNSINWWAYRPPGKAQIMHNILSVGADGKILLWEIPNQSLSEQGQGKGLLKFPIKGWLMLRKKQNVVVPVSGLTMSQSPTNRNVYVVGSQGGSVLRATLAPISHQLNTQGKIVLEMNQGVKFKQQVYPFMLNLLPKNLREVKTHVEKVCVANKVQTVDSLATILNTRPQLRHLYPNPITFAYQPLACPVGSISHNRYGLFIANAGQSYSRIYHQQQKQHIQSIQQGYQWAWLSSSSKMAGFIQQQFVVVDWSSGDVLWSVGIGEGMSWVESGLGMVAVVCDRTKVRVLELGDRVVGESQGERQATIRRISQLVGAQKK